MADAACPLPDRRATDAEMEAILKGMRTIAVVGLSPKPERPSHDVAAALQRQGFRIIPVNPGITAVLGEKAFASLLEIPEPVDVVDVFRDPAAVPEIVEQAIAIKARAVWLQLGVVHNAAAQRARAAGLAVVQDRCLKVEARRLLPA